MNKPDVYKVWSVIQFGKDGLPYTVPYLATEEQRMVSSVLRAFPEEFAEHIEQHRCPRPSRRPMPKLVDLADGTAAYDESFWRKHPDWTYEPE